MKRENREGGGAPCEAPVRVQLSRRRGWRMPENTVKVDRSTPWGNPYVVGRGQTRADCVRYFAALLAWRGVKLGGPPGEWDRVMAFLEHAGTHLGELRGKNLACWCPLGAPCHADVLLEVANAGREGLT